MNREALKDIFASTGLVLEFAKEPFARGDNAKDIFGLDIKRRVKGVARSEYFSMWPGHEENIIHIAATDSKICQLVLTIKEPQREFEIIVQPFQYKKFLSRGASWLVDWIAETKPTVLGRNNGTRFPSTRAATFDDFRWDGRQLWVKTRTPSAVRHFLMGVDERQLFMCQLPRPASSVKQAMESLKSPTVILAEGKQLGRTLRQGEWFLLNPTSDEEAVLKSYLKGTLAVVHKKANVGQYAGRRSGKPHVAEELVEIRDAEQVLEHGFRVRSRPAVFIRGALRHPDHETLKLGAWRKVILNNEAGNVGSAASFGGGWID
jgi:hypothetical protein